MASWDEQLASCKAYLGICNGNPKLPVLGAEPYGADWEAMALCSQQPNESLKIAKLALLRTLFGCETDQNRRLQMECANWWMPLAARGLLVTNRMPVRIPEDSDIERPLELLEANWTSIVRELVARADQVLMMGPGLLAGYEDVLKQPN